MIGLFFRKFPVILRLLPAEQKTTDKKEQEDLKRVKVCRAVLQHINPPCVDKNDGEHPVAPNEIHILQTPALL